MIDRVDYNHAAEADPELTQWVKAKGGPLHPVKLRSADGALIQFSGMTVRDWLAGRAMMAMAIAYGGRPCDDDHIAKRAYEVADAMLRARGK